MVYDYRRRFFVVKVRYRVELRMCVDVCVFEGVVFVLVLFDFIIFIDDLCLLFGV